MATEDFINHNYNDERDFPKRATAKRMSGMPLTEARREAERIVSNMEGATQIQFPEEHGYRNTLILNVEAGLKRFAGQPVADRSKSVREFAARCFPGVKFTEPELKFAEAYAAEQVISKEVVIAELKKRVHLFNPHPDGEDCPTFYDGCHCTVENLLHNIDRAEIAERAVEESRDHHARDRGHAARTPQESIDFINSDHPCCLPIGDVCQITGALQKIERVCNQDALAKLKRPDITARSWAIHYRNGWNDAINAILKKLNE